MKQVPLFPDKSWKIFWGWAVPRYMPHWGGYHTPFRRCLHPRAYGARHSPRSKILYPPLAKLYFSWPAEHHDCSQIWCPVRASRRSLSVIREQPFPFGTAVFKLKCLRLALGIHASQDFQTATGVTVTGTFNLYKQKRLRFKSEWRFAAPVSHQSPSRSSVVFQWYDTHCTIVCSNVNISLQSKISLRN